MLNFKQSILLNWMWNDLHMLRDGFKVDLKTGYEINKQTIVSINIIVK